VQAAGVVLLDDEARETPLSPPAPLGLRGLLEVALAAIGV